MRVLLVALALVAAAWAYDMEDVPAHMKDRLDRYIILKNQWRDKWLGMTEAEQKNYEQVLLSRIEHIPQMQHQRLHDKIASLPEEQRAKMLDYLRRRFPKEEQGELKDDTDEIDEIIKALPEYVRQKINEVIWIQFQEATAYNTDGEVAQEDELAFPDIPELIDIPEATAYSSQLPAELIQRLDEFLLKREDWKDKWERLSEEKKEVFERYIKERLE